MVLSLLISFGTAVGAHEGIKASMAKARKEEHRSRKNNLIVHCPKSSQYSPYLESRRVVLSGDRLFIDTGTVHDAPFGHPFEGYYLPYPDSRYGGLVTTITHEAPIMNWVFVDPLTYQLRFGVRAVADCNLTGPFDCTRQDRRLTFCGWEGFCAVLEDTGVWGLYFDRDGDGLRRMFGQEGRVVIEIELERKELRTPKPELEPEEAPAPQKDEQSPQQQEQSSQQDSQPAPKQQDQSSQQDSQPEPQQKEHASQQEDQTSSESPQQQEQAEKQQNTMPRDQDQDQEQAQQQAQKQKSGQEEQQSQLQDPTSLEEQHRRKASTQPEDEGFVRVSPPSPQTAQRADQEAQDEDTATSTLVKAEEQRLQEENQSPQAVDGKETRKSRTGKRNRRSKKRQSASIENSEKESVA